MLISKDGARFAFHKQELAVLTSMMADEDKEQWAALWLHPAKAQAWATDGIRAVLAEREPKPDEVSPGAKAVAIPAATVHHAAKTARPRDVVVIDISDSRVSIDVREPMSRGLKIDGFDRLDEHTRSKHAVTCRRHEGGPDSIDECFPLHHGRGAKGATTPLDAGLLAPVVQLAKLAQKNGQVWINVGRTRDPVSFVARADASTVWRMVVMPLRGEREEHPDHGRGSTTKKDTKEAPALAGAPPSRRRRSNRRVA